MTLEKRKYNVNKSLKNKQTTCGPPKSENQKIRKSEKQKIRKSENQKIRKSVTPTP